MAICQSLQTAVTYLISSADAGGSSSWQGGSSSKNSKIIDLVSDDEPMVDPAEWIGTGKRWANIPPYIWVACQTTREISTSLIHKIPSRDILSTEFLSIALPQILSDNAAIPRCTTAWFSFDAPNC
jgi:hypothetical protein